MAAKCLVPVIWASGVQVETVGVPETSCKHTTHHMLHVIPVTSPWPEISELKSINDVQDLS